MIWEGEPEVPKKKTIGRRPAILTLFVLIVFLIYFASSVLLVSGYKYTRAQNCSESNFNEVSGSAYAVATQFFNPYANITPQLITACQKLQAANNQSMPTGFPIPPDPSQLP
jgi:amino acid transporter